MAFVSCIEDSHALIFDGPVMHGVPDNGLLASSSLDAVPDCWLLTHLKDKRPEWPALQKNAFEALDRIERLATVSPGRRRLLDVGSGWGFFLAAARQRGWTPYGLEPLLAQAAYARATFGLEIVTDTLHKDTFRPDSFDVVTSFQVFEHLPHPREAIECLGEALRPGGLVLIEVPNFNTWTMKVLGSRHRHFVEDHLNFFSVDTLGRLLVQGGFEILEHGPTARWMSVRHLVSQWCPRYLPAAGAQALRRALERTRLWEQMLRVSVGDIIYVVARKAAKEAASRRSREGC